MSTERQYEVRTYEVRRFCDCGGEMVSDGMALLCNPPLYPHRCNTCREVERFREQYPLIRYVRVDGG